MAADTVAPTEADADAAPSLDFFGRFSDRVNPILVKETRQVLKSRGFVITFILLITSLWLVSVLGALKAGVSLEYFSWAPWFLSAYLIPLTIASFLIIPFVAYYSLLSERLDDTYELLSITTLRARQIVNGKLLNAMVQVLLFFVTFTPFVAFTSLLQGFRLMPVSLLMISIFAIALALCSATLFIASITRNRLFQMLLMLGMIIGLLSCCSLLNLLYETDFWAIPNEWEIWAEFSMFWVLLFGVAMLFREFAIARITFESDNRSTGIRVVSTLLIVVLATIVPLLAWALSPTVSGFQSLEYFVILMIPVSITATILGMLFCTEPVMLSRRIAQQTRSWSGPLRTLSAPWMPGGTRGYLLICLWIIPLLALCLVSYEWAIRNPYMGSMGSSTQAQRALHFGLSAGLYVLIFIGMVSILNQAFRRTSSKPTTTVIRLLCVILVCGVLIIPPMIVLFLEGFSRYRYSWSEIFIISPFFTLVAITRDSANSTGIVGILAMFAMSFVVINLPSMASGVLFMRADAPAESLPKKESPDGELA